MTALLSPSLARSPYHFAVRFEEGVFGRAWLNELPVHKVPKRGPDSMTGGANHLLVPGKNKLALEIWDMPAYAPSPARKIAPPVEMKIYQVVDPQAEPMTIAEIAGVSLPLDSKARGDKPTMLPLYHEVEFDLPFPVTEPVFWSAPRHEVPCGGTQALLALIHEVHDAFRERDAARVLDLLSLKQEAYAAAYPGEPSAAVDRQRAQFERFLGTKPRIKPLDFSKVHFETRLGGRVVYVSGWDDRPVLEAVSETEPPVALRANLLLTEQNGQFRIFG